MHAWWQMKTSQEIPKRKRDISMNLFCNDCTDCSIFWQAKQPNCQSAQWLRVSRELQTWMHTQHIERAEDRARHNDADRERIKWLL